MSDLITFLTTGVGLAIVLAMIVGYFFWPILLVYAVISQSRSLRRIADAVERGVYDAPRAPGFPATQHPDPVIARDPGIVGSAFGR
jgi:hypothetical protein